MISDAPPQQVVLLWHPFALLLLGVECSPDMVVDGDDRALRNSGSYDRREAENRNSHWVSLLISDQKAFSLPFSFF